MAACHRCAPQPGEGAAQGDGAGAGGAAATARVPHWRLVVDGQELPLLCERFAAAAEAARGGAEHESPEAARAAHEADSWRLVEILFASLVG